MVVQISRVIVHEIPKGRYVAESGIEVSLSNAETPIAATTKRFIEENMLEFSLASTRQIVEDVDAGSSVPGLVREVLSEPSSFVEASKEIARCLYRAQTGNSPSGILIVATVDADTDPSVVLLKAEHAEGMRLQRVGDESTGRFDLQHLNELIVGNNSRIYKIAVLKPESDFLIGRLVDHQNGATFAEFFMSTFLGCRLADNSEVQTRQFMNSSMSWINNTLPDESKRTEYATALLAYMASPRPTFQADEFANEFISAEHQDSFLDSIPDELSSSVVNKNLALVPGKGSGLKMFGPGFVVSASADALDRGDLEVLSESPTSTTIRVRGALKKFGLGSAPKG